VPAETKKENSLLWKISISSGGKTKTEEMYNKTRLFWGSTVKTK